MRSRSHSLTNTLASYAFARKQRGPRHKGGIFRRLRFEKFEDRRVLAALFGNVGSLISYEYELGALASDGEGIGDDDYTGVVSDSDTAGRLLFVRGADALDSPIQAETTLQGYAWIPTSVASTTDFPTVWTSAGSYSEALRDGIDLGAAQSEFEASAEADFEFSNSTAIDYEFWGVIHFTWALSAAATNSDSMAVGNNALNGSIKLDDDSVLSVDVTGSVDNHFMLGSDYVTVDARTEPAEFTMSISGAGFEPIEIDGQTFVSAYVYIREPISHEDVVALSSDSIGLTYALVGNGLDSLSSASTNYVGSMAVYGFVRPINDPIPWLPGEEGELHSIFHHELAPADLNGDGNIDLDDMRALNAAPPLVVTSEEDVDNGNYAFHDLSLREAIALASDVDHPGKDTIVFAQWVDEIVIDSELTIAADNDVQIAGPGVDLLSIDGDGSSRVFNVASGAEVTISGLTITGGNVASGNGEAIYSASSLSLKDVVVTGNSGSGSAIHQVGGSLSLLRSAVENNSGSGMRVENATSLSVVSSTIAENTGGIGAGVLVSNTNAEFKNTTVSGNHSSSVYGGVLILASASSYSAVFVNCTITDNTVGAPTSTGGIAVSSSNPAYITVALYNTIVAGNGGASDVVGTFNSASANNLIGAINGSTGLSGNNTQYGTSSARLDPQLEVLGDYGGPTRTHKLKAVSVAKNNGSNYYADLYDLDYDQRGQDRTADDDLDDSDTVDIGAFELAFDEY